MNRNFTMVMVLSGMVTAACVAMADDERASRRRGPGVAPVGDALYAQECGSCHMAYPPGLLPARSWQRLMENLADHFGDNAEMSREDAAAITGYLTDNAADRSSYPRSVRIAASLAPQNAPLRITELPYIAHEHHEIPPRLIAGNPQVRSLSQCPACHTKAEAGSFSEHEIYIPGFGPVEDD